MTVKPLRGQTRRVLQGELTALKARALTRYEDLLATPVSNDLRIIYLTGCLHEIGSLQKRLEQRLAEGVPHDAPSA